MPTLNLSDLNVIISVLGNYLLAFPAQSWLSMPSYDLALMVSQGLSLASTV